MKPGERRPFRYRTYVTAERPPPTRVAIACCAPDERRSQVMLAIEETEKGGSRPILAVTKRIRAK